MKIDIIYLYGIVYWPVRHFFTTFEFMKLKKY